MTPEELEVIEQRIEQDIECACWCSEGYPIELKDRIALLEEVKRLQNELKISFHYKKDVKRGCDDAKIWQDSLDHPDGV